MKNFINVTIGNGTSMMIQKDIILLVSEFILDPKFVLKPDYIKEFGSIQTLITVRMDAYENPHGKESRLVTHQKIYVQDKFHAIRFQLENV